MINKKTMTLTDKELSELNEFIDSESVMTENNFIYFRIKPTYVYLSGCPWRSYYTIKLNQLVDFCDKYNFSIKSETDYSISKCLKCSVRYCVMRRPEYKDRHICLDISKRKMICYIHYDPPDLSCCV